MIDVTLANVGVYTRRVAWSRLEATMLVLASIRTGATGSVFSHRCFSFLGGFFYFLFFYLLSFFFFVFVSRHSRASLDAPCVAKILPALKLQPSREYVKFRTWGMCTRASSSPRSVWLDRNYFSRKLPVITVADHYYRPYLSRSRARRARFSFQPWEYHPARAPVGGRNIAIVLTIAYSRCKSERNDLDFSRRINSCDRHNHMQRNTFLIF